MNKNNVSISLLASGYVSIANDNRSWVVRSKEFLDTLKVEVKYWDKSQDYDVDISFQCRGTIESIYIPNISERKALGIRKSVFESLKTSTNGQNSAGKRRGGFKTLLLTSLVAGLSMGWYLFSPIPVVTTVVSTESTEFATDATISNLLAIASQAGIPVLSDRKYGDKPIPFYVLSRPGCADCAPADLALQKVSTDFLPIIIPTSFENNQKSIYAVSHVYCAEKPDVAWAEYAKGKALPDAQAECNWNDRAKLAVMASSITELGKSDDSRPIIVAPNGAVFRGKVDVEDPVAGLNEWLNNNRKES